MKYLGLLIVLILLYIYHPWSFVNKTLSGGDWPYLFLENIKEFKFLPDFGFFWLVPYYQGGAKILVEYIGLSWNIAEKILWFWPFLIFSIISSFYLTKSWIGVLIYTASTYPLMLVGGGQMGVGIAYSLSPLVLAIFIRIINKIDLVNKNFQFSIFNFQLLEAGLVLALQVMFDPRITYATFIAIFLYLFFTFIFSSNKKRFAVNSFFLIIPVFVSVALNSFWIISLLKYGLPPQDLNNLSTLGFRFLSFADFSHTISALHPNWPENIFGKTYFLQPEFILLPILAYSSLLFIKISNLKSQISKPQLKSQNFNNLAIEQFSNRTILFFAFLGLIGTFLSKGANPPFGVVNEFLFNNFPGMSMFRDPTKFYLLIVLSYSVLIPFSICSIQDWLKSKINPDQIGIKNQSRSNRDQKSKIQIKIQNYFSSLFLIFTILYLIFLIRPVVMGGLGGTFKPREVPQEYVQFKDFIHGQPQSFKTLWIPQKQRFGFSSKDHPAINAAELFGTGSAGLIIKELKKSNLQFKFRNGSIKYLIIPYDSEKEIFLKDRKYNEEDRTTLVKTFKSLSWLRQLQSFKQISVFEVIY